MSALVRKEIRLILPAWALAMMLAILPVWLLWPGVSYGFNLQAPGALVYGPFALGVLLLGLAPFGHELNYGTFSILLAQPASRWRLWVAKTLVVGGALLIVFAALSVSNSIRVTTVIASREFSSDWQRAFSQIGTKSLILGMIAMLRHEILYGTLVYGGLSALTAFAGGLWTNLLFRNTSAAFWFSLLIPLGLGMIVQGVFGSVGVVADVALVGTLVLYSVAGFIWAKKYFLQVQDVQWTGGIISFPTWSSSRAAAKGIIERKHKPLRALFCKELQFQQINLFIAGLLLLTHLVDIAVRKFAAGYFLMHRQAAMIWESWPLLWLAMPFLIGAVAVAEERKLGTLETLLCLPTRRRREFLVKFGVAVVLGIFLGGVMPVFVEWLGTLAGLHSNAGTLAVNWTMIPQVWALLVGSAALVVLAFYASTLTRNLLAALGLAVAWSAVAFLLTELVIAIGQMGYDRVALWGGKLPLLSILPVMFVAVVWLSFANFKRLHTSSRLWIRNVFVLVASLLCSAVVTTATYYRVWEVWMPDEPAHGNRVLFQSHDSASDNFVQPKIETSLAHIAAVLPDGRLWLRRGQVEQVNYKDSGGNPRSMPRETGPWHSGFIAGTNWLDVAVTSRQCFAIKKDGSLWDLSDLIPGAVNSDAPKRVGNNPGWKAITAGANRFTALKTDGTLWQWGALLKADGTNISTETVSAPRQLGTDNSWIAIADSGRSAGGAAIREDGSVWRYGFIKESRTPGPRLVQGPERWLSGPREKPRSVSFDGNTLLLVLEDGSFWGWGYDSPLFASDAPLSHELFRMGGDSDWLEAHLFRGDVLAIKRNQLLWLSSMRRRLEPVVSRYDEWLAVCPTEDQFLGLAMDGSLCQWNLSALYGANRRHFWGENQLLMPSRIKANEIANLR